MKKKIILLLLIAMVFSCKIPKLLKQDNANYKVTDWEGGKFYFVSYHWNGKDFTDAIDIIKGFVDLVKDRALNDETAIGRFEEGKDWQLGIVTKNEFQLKEFKGKKIESIDIPSGKYAALKTTGYPEYIFLYYDKLKNWALHDGYKIESPAIEIYKLTFDEKTDVKNRIGEVRYQVSK
jgi:hypothetical protein